MSFYSFGNKKRRKRISMKPVTTISGNARISVFEPVKNWLGGTVCYLIWRLIPERF